MASNTMSSARPALNISPRLPDDLCGLRESAALCTGALPSLGIAAAAEPASILNSLQNLPAQVPDLALFNRSYPLRALLSPIGPAWPASSGQNAKRSQAQPVSEPAVVDILRLHPTFGLSNLQPCNLHARTACTALSQKRSPVNQPLTSRVPRIEKICPAETLPRNIETKCRLRFPRSGTSGNQKSKIKNQNCSRTLVIPQHSPFIPHARKHLRSTLRVTGTPLRIFEKALRNIENSQSIEKTSADFQWFTPKNIEKMKFLAAASQRLVYGSLLGHLALGFWSSRISSACILPLISQAKMKFPLIFFLCVPAPTRLNDVTIQRFNTSTFQRSFLPLAFPEFAPTLRPRMINLSSLNPQQRLAAETIKGPVLILAGAGTGKTRVITFRIAHMIARGIKPANILAVTFTNKAAREMFERVQKLVPTLKKAKGEKVDRPTICTFHSLCVRILRQHIEKLGYKRNFVIYSESDQIGALKKVLSNISAKGEKLDPREILSLLSKYRNGGARAAGISDSNALAFAQHIESRYQTALHACNAVDFDDLILLTLRLFKEHPDALESCRDKFRYVMVDEYQDTNAAQFQLVHALTEKHRNFCVVGDDDQSIYGWRGAEVANLLELENHFPEVKMVKLEQNYRSTNTILNAANAVIKNNARRRGKQLWSQKGDGSKITLYEFDDDEEEARTLVEEIEFCRVASRIPWSDQAILFRTNIQSRPIEIALRKAEVRYHLIGGQSYFDRREIKDLLAFLKVFLNPNDEISLLRIANVPARGLTETTMERLLAASHEHKCSVYAAMTNPVVHSTFLARAREAITSFIDLLHRHRVPLHQNAQLNLKDWAHNFLSEINYYEELRRGEKDPETAENRIENVKELLNDLETTGEPNDSPVEKIEAFLDDVTLDSDRAEEKERTGDAVTLITMHSCKGLEFPHVYIVGLEEGLLPHSRSKLEGTIDEERRLFYVAITRAMQTLTVSHCETRKKYGQPMPCHPSSFLKELPEHLVQHGDALAKQPVSVDSGKNLFAGIRASIGT